MRLIDADVLIEELRDLYKKKGWHYKEIHFSLADMEMNVLIPPAVPVVHGKWIYEGARGRIPACRCSACGNVENADWAMISGEVNYCPHCGADMRGKEP